MGSLTIVSKHTLTWAGGPLPHSLLSQ